MIAERVTTLSTGSPRAKRLGFTLVELLVVLAVIGMIVGMSVPGLVHYSRQVRLKATTRELTAMLSLARSLAMGSRTKHAVVFDEEGYEIRVVNLESGEANEQKLALPRGISVEVRVGDEPAAQQQVIFRPTGGLQGRTTVFALSNGEREMEVQVTGVTGSVSVE